MSFDSNMFKNRLLVIATKHYKEKVIAPVFENEFGVKCIVPQDFDTDEWGTFSGEIERLNDPITTARTKCLEAMKAAKVDLAIASEGSFGAHPQLFFVPAGDEILMLVDKKNDIEIVVRDLSTETNFYSTEVKNLVELEEFIKKVNFPSHGVIVKDSPTEFNYLVKGIVDKEYLIETYNDFISKYGKAFIETDMRALFNPTRMQRIELLAHKLADKVKSLCPKCQTPGFGIVKANPGLPCGLCGTPTKSTLSYQLCCKKCGHSQEDKFPKGKQVEDPMYCDICNP
jgi:hypothetical protein